MTNFSTLVMSASRSYIISSIVFLALSCLISCGAPELIPDGKASGGGTTSSEDVSDADALTVVEALSHADTAGVKIVGYIVGHAVGSNLRSDGVAHFNIPDSENTNLLLSDTASSKNAAYCLPVALESGSQWRKDFNLSEHRELWHKRVVVCGNLTNYYGVKGIRKINYIKLCNSSAYSQFAIPVVETKDSVFQGR